MKLPGTSSCNQVVHTDAIGWCISVKSAISKKISQPEAAHKASCSPQAIGHYENGRMEIPDSRLKCLLEFYGFSDSEFQEYINGKPIPIVSIKDECIFLIDQIPNEEKLRAVHTILKSFVS